MCQQFVASINIKEKDGNMELKEAYIDKIICHHFSVDASKCLINHAPMQMGNLDESLLKEFFIKPFTKVKAVFSFSHPVDLSFNIVYQTVVKLMQNADFVNCSHDIFRHLQSTSAAHNVKDGDIFVACVSDIIINNSYYDGFGIFKVEHKNDFIETFIDEHGNMQFAVKSGFLSNRIDKGCLIVMTENMPQCYIIDKSKDYKSWQQDFLRIIPQPNAYTQSREAMQVFQSFVNEKLSSETKISKDERIKLINQFSDVLKKSESIRLTDAVMETCEDERIMSMFSEYCQAYEKRENVNLSGDIPIDVKTITTPKKIRTIKLDDTAEICLLKTGTFIERGFDKQRGMNYYRLFFSKEK